MIDQYLLISPAYIESTIYDSNLNFGFGYLIPSTAQCVPDTWLLMLDWVIKVTLQPGKSTCFGDCWIDFFPKIDFIVFKLVFGGKFTSTIAAAAACSITKTK